MLFAAALFSCAFALPSPPLFFEQQVDHFSISNATFSQRYYQNATSFKGPGSPIICIMGGEEEVSPAKGILYPSLVVLAARLGALIVEPEHRFFGASLPIPPPYSTTHLALLTPQQALADAAALIEATRVARKCTGRGGQPRCPVITAGGSYPGFQALAMRLRYPAEVDMAYSASPALRFYSQEVGGFDYYARITEAAGRSSPRCPSAVRAMLSATIAGAGKAAMVEKLGLCTPLPGYLEAGDATLLTTELAMVFQYTFADLNMGAYPLLNSSFQRACDAIVADAPSDPWGALAAFFSSYVAGSGGCFNLSAQLPSGANATISSGDWSGVGVGDDGASWDFMTCTLLVEPIGTNNVSDMFYPRAWAESWLQAHCGSRFGVKPQPHTLADEWGLYVADLPRVTSHVVFTNGLNDGWSVGGVTSNLSDTLIAFNMKTGAHHSDLNYKWPSPETDTAEVLMVRELVARTFEGWLAEIAKK